MKSNHTRAFVVLAIACTALATTGPSQAQTYRCSAGGSAYLSDRPCGAGQPTGRVGAYGPQSATRMPYAPMPQRLNAVESHVKYLGAECASISEGMRTASARGVPGQVIQELHREYREKCTVEDQEARRRVQQDQSREQGLRLAQRDANNLSRAQAQQQSDRCAGMRDVVGLKRSRESSLNEKEVAALRTLESTFNAECLKRP